MIPTDTERWAPVVGHEGKYEVSDLGRVRSVDRAIQTKLLKPGRMSTGYLSVALGRGNSVMVQWMVLEAFVGPRPDLHDADHINRTRDDNRLTNLRWLHRTANRQYLGRWFGKYQGVRL